MSVLFKIAWRNIWRNRKRSLILVTAIALGLTCGNFISSAYMGLMNKTIEESIEKQISHIQLHKPEFIADREIRYSIEGGREIAKEVQTRPGVKSVSARTKLDGMVASAHLTAGISILGVDPVQEAKTTGIDRDIAEGSFFSQEGRLPQAVIGKELADELQCGPGSRIVITFQDREGDIISSSFRVEGIFTSGSSVFEKTNLFVKQSELGAIAGSNGDVTEIAILLEEEGMARAFRDELRETHPGLSVRDWREISPDLEYVVEITEVSLLWIMAVIMLGMAFGILNTTLMSVLERTREFGMLMSVGMKRIRIFTMVIAETVMLSLTGGAAGFAASLVLIRVLRGRGIDLTAIGGEALRDFGFSPFIYPELHTGFYLKVGVMIVLFAILAAVYPARKATRLQPAEAVRKD